MINLVLWVCAMFLVWITALPLVHVGLATLIVVTLTGINVARTLGMVRMKQLMLLTLIAIPIVLTIHFWWIIKYPAAAALAVLAVRYIWVTVALVRHRPFKQAAWMLVYRAFRVAATLLLIWVVLNPVSLTLFGSALLYWAFSNFRYREFRFRLF